MIFLSIANLSQEHKLIDMQVWRNLSEYPNLWFGNTNLCKIYFNRFCRQTNLSQEHKLINMQVWRNLSEYPNLWFGNTNLCKIYFNRFCRQTNLSQEHKLIDMQVWRNWQTRMVQVHMKAISCRFKSCYLHHKEVLVHISINTS